MLMESKFTGRVYTFVLLIVYGSVFCFFGSLPRIQCLKMHSNRLLLTTCLCISVDGKENKEFSFCAKYVRHNMQRGGGDINRRKSAKESN